MSASTTRAICIFVVSLSAGVAYGADHPCEELKNGTASQRIKYLRGDRATLKPACVDFAIEALSHESSLAAADVLVSYLDFRSSRSQAEAVSHLLWKPEYPAAEALVEMGSPATESLVRAIASADSSDIQRTNAGDVLILINGGHPMNAIRLLRERSKSAPDTATSARLFESAIRLSRQCPDEIRSSCEAALN
jgi:hypothetical protein